MNDFVSTIASPRPRVRNNQQISQKTPIQLWLAAILGLVLLAAPRSRVVVVAPLYFIDMFAFLLLILPLHGGMNRWVPRIPISKIVPVYMGTILVSELRGMAEYGTLIESTYMIGRYMIAISLYFTVPRLVSRPEHVNLILKGLLLGTLLSSVIVILYSLGPTRSLVANTVFANGYLNPGWQRFLEKVAIFGANESAMRGRSLVGASTMTAGFLSITWPIAFIAYYKFAKIFLWKQMALGTVILAPIAILMTYGRGAWIMVGVVILLVAVFGLASGRKILLMVLVGGSVAVSQIEVDSDLFYLDRITGQTQVTIDKGVDDRSTSERLLSYVEPFTHLLENPVWILAGAGQTGNKMKFRGELIGNQLYDEVGLATHSAFAKAYYNFGVVAAICQVLFVILGFRFIIVRAMRIPTANKEQKIIWQSLLMSWCTYSLWWASGHAMVGQPRGVMLSFFLFGLVLSFEKLRVFDFANKHKRTFDRQHQFNQW